MLNRLYNDSRVNAKIMDNVSNNGAPMTAKQRIWLETAQKNYTVTIKDFNSLTVSQASLRISEISIAIASGKVKPRVKTTDEVFYAVIKFDNDIRVKSFIGTYDTVSAKIMKNYHQSLVKLVTKDIDEAKHLARRLSKQLEAQSEVAITTTEVDNLLLSLRELSVEDLKDIAKSNSINLGRASKKETIIKKLYEQLAS